jgi:hypothetical protein
VEENPKYATKTDNQLGLFISELECASNGKINIKPKLQYQVELIPVNW